MGDITALIKKYEADMIGIRRHIHENPELSNEEIRTTALIREKLEEYGIEILEIGLKTKNRPSVCILCGWCLSFLWTRYPCHSPPVLRQGPFGAPG